MLGLESQLVQAFVARVLGETIAGIGASQALIFVSGVRNSCDASIMNSLLMRSTSRNSANAACSSSIDLRS
jgi:hypothetical protein